MINRRRIEDEHRVVELADYRDMTLRVVTGYDAVHDRWPFHVFITGANGKTVKFEAALTSDSLDGALRRGFMLGEQAIEQELSKAQSSEA